MASSTCLGRDLSGFVGCRTRFARLRAFVVPALLRTRTALHTRALTTTRVGRAFFTTLRTPIALAPGVLWHAPSLAGLDLDRLHFLLGTAGEPPENLLQDGRLGLLDGRSRYRCRLLR